MMASMRPRLVARTCDAVVSLLVLTLTTPALADSYDDEEGAAEPGEGETTDPEPEEEGLSAGGLHVPGNFQAGDEQGDEVSRELEEADRRDSGRGLEFAWLVGDLGLGVVDAAGIDRGQLLAPGDASSGVGLGYGGGLGVRVLYFTLGARIAGASAGDISTLGGGGELGMKLPLGNIEPLVLLDVGYVSVSGLAKQAAPGGLADVSGLGLNLGLGADYYLSDHFSLGMSARFGLLFLGRPAQDPGAFSDTMDPVYAAGASGTGTNLALTARIGFHL
jgi:hypothetical protein